jgi:hypothetical protein
METSIIGALGAIAAAWIIRGQRRIHILVNSNLTAITKVAREAIEENLKLKSQIAMLKGEPGSTDVS